MPDAPPTSAGPLPPSRPWRANSIVLGVAIHSLCVLLTCFIVPLAMNSNIWPIAGVFWSVLAVPVAAATGALAGWLVKRLRPPIAIAILVFTAAILAAAMAIIMAHNR